MITGYADHYEDPEKKPENPREALSERERALCGRVIDLAALLLVTDVKSLEKIAAFLLREGGNSKVFAVAEETVREAMDVRLE
jgi:hypothetical protein